MEKIYFSVKSLLELKIPSLPKYKPHLIAKAKREGWEFRKKLGKGGGFEYAFFSMPKNVQEEILALRTSTYNDIVELERSSRVQEQAVILDDLQPYQKESIEARAFILSHIEQIAKIVGINKAIEKFKDSISNNEVSEEIKQALIKANGKSAQQAKISRATIYNWRKVVKDSGSTISLTTKEIRKAEWPSWGDALLRLWQRPQKPTLKSCLEDFKEISSKIPSYSAANRFIKKLPKQIQAKGRLGTREIKKFKAYVSRDTSNLWPTAVYTADGHTFDAEVEHPRTGKPFRPEITTVVDVYTRKVVGWSLDLSERTNSVYMALASSIVTHGIPLIWYVDNGKGFNNKFFDNDVVGLLSRLEIRKENSIAYNSQSRGIGERIHQTIWVKAAKNLSTYMGADMDAQAKQAAFKQTRGDIAKAGKSKILMKWVDFIEYCKKCVEIYNNNEHSGLPIMLDQSAYKKRHYTPNEFWNKSVMNGFVADKLTQSEVRDLYKYYEIRRTNRGRVDLFNNNYFSLSLEPYTGRDVAVCYDINDASKVWVRELVDYNGELKSGKLICEAIFGGNKCDYFPISALEQRDLKRKQGRINRLQNHINDAEDEIKDKFIECQYQTDIEDFTTLRQTSITPSEKNIPIAQDNESRPIFANDISWINWLLSNPNKITPQDSENLLAIIKKPEYAMLFEAEDISVEDIKALIKKTA